MAKIRVVMNFDAQKSLDDETTRVLAAHLVDALDSFDGLNLIGATGIGVNELADEALPAPIDSSPGESCPFGTLHGHLVELRKCGQSVRNVSVSLHNLLAYVEYQWPNGTEEEAQHRQYLLTELKAQQRRLTELVG